MSCSNIGARKRRNIRDHLFVINSILFEANAKKSDPPIDIEIYDVRKCFDKMWASETSNDVFDAGLQDDQFVLMANANKTCEVAVKNGARISERMTLTNIEMQGTIMAPLKCSIQIDSLGKQYLRDTELSNQLYKYKGYVPIPHFP